MAGVTLHGMDEDPDVSLTAPPECQAWCAAQNARVVIDDDMVRVDLDWWNTRLRRASIPVLLVGRDPDGREVESGEAALRRGDLASDTDQLTEHGPHHLTVLYRCAAWLREHPDRPRPRRFPDVRSSRKARAPFAVIGSALAACRETPNLFDGGPFREWSGWPIAPGVGHPLLTLYSWAVHDGDTQRPQLLDQAAVAMLVRLGWVADPAVGSFTPRRYQRYNDLLHRWADRTGTEPELIEHWLSRSWRELESGPRVGALRWPGG